MSDRRISITGPGLDPPPRGPGDPIPFETARRVTAHPDPTADDAALQPADPVSLPRVLRRLAIAAILIAALSVLFWVVLPSVGLTLHPLLPITAIIAIAVGTLLSAADADTDAPRCDPDDEGRPVGCCSGPRPPRFLRKYHRPPLVGADASRTLSAHPYEEADPMRPITRLAIALIPAAAALAGDLTPPPGNPAPTMLPLNLVEPRTPVGPDTTPGNAQTAFVISQPGSYYLTSDLTIADGEGIRIAADHVTLDLNGFTVRKTTNDPNQNSGRGVFTLPLSGSGSVDAPRVLNGRVTGGFVTGVDFRNAINGRIEDITVTATGRPDSFPFGPDGFAVYVGPQGLIIRCIANNNFAFGLVGDGAGSAIIDSIAVNNGTEGISVNNGLIKGCSAVGNLVNINASDGTTVVDTHAP